MENNIIEKLFVSFTELEEAIGSAKETLASRSSVPADIIARLKSYDGILGKQRSLAADLCEHISAGNWGEVSRHVGLINGLSAMIRDDAKAILSSIALNSDTESSAFEETKIC